MGLSKICDLYKRNEAHMTEAALDLKEKDLNSSQPNAAFENITVAEFVQGWSLSTETSYSEFIKDKNLDLAPLKSALNTHMEIKCEQALLDKERIARKEMGNCWTAIHLIELVGELIDNLPEQVQTDAQLSAPMMKALARIMTPILKVATTKWMISKMKVRRSIFRDRTNQDVRTLLKSSLWEANILPTKHINSLKRDGPSHNLIPILGL